MKETVKGNKPTPLLRQYESLKSQHPDELLLFRMGDFYEFFFEDAEKASKLLDITLTTKPISKGHRIPLAGIPVKAAENYVAKLLKKGYRVAICEQVGNEEKGSLMKREVVEVITPGTVFSETILDAKKHNYIAAVYEDDVNCGAAICDISTGDFMVVDSNKNSILEELRRLEVRELLLSEENNWEGAWVRIALTPEEFSTHDAEDKIKAFFGVKTLSGFGIEKVTPSIVASRALVSYLSEKKGGMTKHIKGIRVLYPDEYLYMDIRTIKNLELLRDIRGKEDCSLVGIMDRTLTPMGKRLLRESILRPFSTPEPILKRLRRVEILVEDSKLRRRISALLSGISDIERISIRTGAGKGTPRELVKLAHSLLQAEKIRELLLTASLEVKEIVEDTPEIEDLAREIIDKLVDDPPSSFYEGGFIREGVDPQLDELRRLSKRSKEFVLSLEEKERKTTGIQGLKIRYNNVFGYFIEVRKTQMHLVPSHYVRKQTLTNVERFFTPELKEIEDKILGAEERAKILELQHWEELKGKINERVGDIKTIARMVAEVDLLQSLARLADEKGYVKPIITETGEIEIQEGRHPVVESTIGEPFISNGTVMDLDENRVLIITGPNMSGKSTYLRQVALIVIMAQMGSFVPAKIARIGIIDRIFTRIGATDDLAKGVSTFMAEMIETSEIIHNATRKSLVILDEVGRGTSTYDGLAIAWSVIEYITNTVGSKTLFATHFYELSGLSKKLKAVKNYRIEVKEWGDEVIFLRRLVEGETDRSYGVYVAKLAGLPQDIINRAKEILAELEKRGYNYSLKEEKAKQLSLFMMDEKSI